MKNRRSRTPGAGLGSAMARRHEQQARQRAYDQIDPQRRTIRPFLHAGQTYHVGPVTDVEEWARQHDQALDFHLNRRDGVSSEYHT